MLGFDMGCLVYSLLWAGGEWFCIYPSFQYLFIGTRRRSMGHTSQLIVTSSPGVHPDQLRDSTSPSCPLFRVYRGRGGGGGRAWGASVGVEREVGDGVR